MSVAEPGLLARLIEAGVTPALPRRDARYVRALNGLGAVLALQSIVYLPLFGAGLPSTLPLLLLNAIMLFGWVSLPFINARGHTDAARWVALVTAVIQVGGVSVLCGRDTWVHLYFVGGIAFAFAVFPRSRPRGLATYALVCTTCFFLIQFGLERPLLDLPPWVSTAMKLSSVTGLVVFVALVSALAYREILRADDEAEAQYQRSERLLSSILPPSVAERLKGGPQTIADGVPASTILFADIVGFTALSQTVGPTELVRMLDDIFRRFDALVAHHGLEKIKTIGDAYMAASGVPDPCPNHVERAAGLALAMVDEMERLRERYPGLQLRIGLHTGPLVAGVIGTSKFAYDVWGDTVNTASRMESHGIPGRIQVKIGRAHV